MPRFNFDINNVVLVTRAAFFCPQNFCGDPSPNAKRGRPRRVPATIFFHCSKVPLLSPTTFQIERPAESREESSENVGKPSRRAREFRGAAAGYPFPIGFRSPTASPPLLTPARLQSHGERKTFLTAVRGTPRRIHFAHQPPLPLPPPSSPLTLSVRSEVLRTREKPADGLVLLAFFPFSAPTPARFIFHTSENGTLTSSRACPDFFFTPFGGTVLRGEPPRVRDFANPGASAVSIRLNLPTLSTA